jgi:hypothetical protein
LKKKIYSLWYEVVIEIERQENRPQKVNRVSRLTECTESVVLCIN